MESAKHKVLSARERVNEKFRHVSLEMETSTHFPILMKVIRATEGPILEMGSGLFSTPLLHWMCFETRRKITTCESYKHYLEFAEKFRTDWHEVIYLDPNTIPRFDTRFSVVFIDHSPKPPRKRGSDALLFKDSDYIVMHDAGNEPYDKYGYKEIYNQFKYTYHWDRAIPNTTILSNHHDLSWLN